MISYVIDGVLLLALVLTSLRVGAMYRELKRLRGYQAQYVEVFGETSRAADHIGKAVRELGSDGRDVLERLEAAIREGRELAGRIDRPEIAPIAAPAREEDEVGLYSRQGRIADLGRELEPAVFRNEILKFGADNRRPDDAWDEPAGGTPPAPQRAPTREFRMAPSVKTLRAASGRG